MKKTMSIIASIMAIALMDLATFGCASFKTQSGRAASIDTTGDGLKGSYADPLGNEVEFDTKPED